MNVSYSLLIEYEQRIDQIIKSSMILPTINFFKKKYISSPMAELENILKSLFRLI